MRVSDTSQEISLTICLYLPNTLPSFQFYQCLKILSLQKLRWSSDMPVYKGKEIQEKTIQAPESHLGRGCVWAPRLHPEVPQEPTEAKAKGCCLFNAQTRGVNPWQCSCTMLHSPRARCRAHVRVRACCAGRGCISALSLLLRRRACAPAGDVSLPFPSLPQREAHCCLTNWMGLHSQTPCQEA